MVNDCCKEPSNLEVREQRGDVVMRVCTVCARRHVELSVDPGRLFSRVAPLSS